VFICPPYLTCCKPVPAPKRNLKIGGEKFPEIKSLRAGTYQISGELAWGAKDENSLAFQQRFVVR